jgi:hypothetical protein
MADAVDDFLAALAGVRTRRGEPLEAALLPEHRAVLLAAADKVRQENAALRRRLEAMRAAANEHLIGAVNEREI